MQKIIDSKKEKVLLELIVQCEVGQASALYKSIIEALKLPTGITMHIDYSNIPHKKVFNIVPYWDLEEYNNEAFKWENIFQDDLLVPTIDSPLVVFDGYAYNILWFCFIYFGAYSIQKDLGLE